MLGLDSKKRTHVTHKKSISLNFTKYKSLQYGTGKLANNQDGFFNFIKFVFYHFSAKLKQL